METRENSHDVSLDSGSYRFKVEFKNVFGQVAFVTEYKYFEILEVYQPKLFLISDSAINKERCFDGIFNFNAENLNRQALFYLDGKTKSGESLRLEPEDVTVSGNLVQVKFAPEKIPAGKYNLVVQNPGGLTAISKNIRIYEDGDDGGTFFFLFHMHRKFF